MASEYSRQLNILNTASCR